jgi:1-acyl-sn-glycerol-3-phosphate acyltransferase
VPYKERSIVRKALARLVLRLARWRTVGQIPSSGVLVGAPHTSNWDWVAMLLLMWSGGVPPRVLIKAEIMRTPLGPLLRANGGISLDRQNPGAVVRNLLAEAKTGEPFLLIIAAEGTRKKVDYWKSGFYRIAQQTGLPISMGFIDGPTRTLGFGPTFMPTGDVVADMDVVRAFYADKRGIHPELRTEPRLRAEDAAAQAAAPEDPTVEEAPKADESGQR